MRQHLQNDLAHVRAVRPAANDLTRGWDDAELGKPFRRDETEDYKFGWSLWHHNHGQKRSSFAYH